MLGGDIFHLIHLSSIDFFFFFFLFCVYKDLGSIFPFFLFLIYTDFGSIFSSFYITVGANSILYVLFGDGLCNTLGKLGTQRIIIVIFILYTLFSFFSLYRTGLGHISSHVEKV